MALMLIGCPDGDYCDICNDDEKGGEWKNGHDFEYERIG